MIIDFSHAAEGDFYDIDECVALDDSLTGSRSGRFEGNARLKGWYTFADDVLAVDATLTVPVVFSCDRCGVQVEMTLEIPVSESFFKEQVDEDTLTYADDSVDLQPVIDDRIVLAMPSQVLCGSECKGLCPKCGKNLNEGECSCNIDGGTEDNDASPFSVLKNMNINSGGATNGSTKK